jgi:hypothetical protein
MGCNYYLRQRVADGDRDVLEKYRVELPSLHIGKSSAGWSFTFQALENYQTSEQFDSRYVRCYRDWLYYLEKADVYEIFDEYGGIVEFDQFKKLVESKRSESNHSAQMFSSDENSYRDVEGYSFMKADFS